MKRIMHIVIGGDWRARLRHMGSRAQDGVEQGKYQGEWLCFATPLTFFQHLNTEQLMLLPQLLGSNAIEPQDLARRTGASLQAAQANLQALLRIGLLEETPQGALHCPWAEIHMQFAPAPGHGATDDLRHAAMASAGAQAHTSIPAHAPG